MSLPWMATRIDPDHVHTYPLGDLIAHELDGDDCACGPTTEPAPRGDGSMAWLIRHHSLDGRELHEPGRRQA